MYSVLHMMWYDVMTSLPSTTVWASFSIVHRMNSVCKREHAHRNATAWTVEENAQPNDIHTDRPVTYFVSNINAWSSFRLSIVDVIFWVTCNRPHSRNESKPNQCNRVFASMRNCWRWAIAMVFVSSDRQVRQKKCNQQTKWDFPMTERLAGIIYIQTNTAISMLCHRLFYAMLLDWSRLVCSTRSHPHKNVSMAPDLWPLQMRFGLFCWLYHSFFVVTFDVFVCDAWCCCWFLIWPHAHTF